MTTAGPVNCNDVIRELWDWLDGEMEPARFAAIREHLGACRGCHGHVEFARSFLEHVHQPPVAADEVDALRERVRAALHAQPD
jgi:anti-sigma factor RsiW